MMIYAGINIATLNHFASAIFSDDYILIEAFQFIYDGNHFQLQISRWLKGRHLQYP